MRRKNFVLLLVVVALTGFSLGCSSYAKWQYERARRAEQKGQPENALALFENVLVRIPASDKHWRSETYFHIGECLWNIDRVADAFAAFQRAADADESNRQARLRLGEIYLAGGAPDRASEQAHAVLQLVPTDADASALLGAAASALGNANLAETAFTRVLLADSKRVNVAIALADVYNLEDRLDEARRVLHQAADAQPQSALPWLALGRLEEQEGNIEPAEEAYRKAVKSENSPESNLRLAQFLQRTSRIEEAEQVLHRIDMLRPKLPTALADFQLTTGRVSDALDQYLIAIRSPMLRTPDGKRRLSPKQADMLLDSRVALAARIIETDIQGAYAAGNGGDPAKALDAARLHLMQFRADLDPATAAVLQAELALAHNDVNAAAQYSRSAVNLAPQSAAAHYVLGVVKQRAGDRSGARREWLAAYETDSSFVPARLALASEALREGDAAGAEQFVILVVRDEPANVRALTLFARALAGENRFTSAALIAKRAAAVDANSAEPHIILAEIALAQSQFAAALVAYEHAILLDPHSTAAIEGLTRVYRHGAVTRSMLRNLEAAGERKPESATLMEIAGRLYAERGWYDDAQRCLRRALQLDPRRSTAATALAQAFAATGEVSAATASATQAGGQTAALFSAFTAQQRNDLARAVKEYEAALKQGENSGVAANNLAWLYAQQGRLDQALLWAEKARSLAPKNPAVLDTVGVVHLRRHEYTQAVEVLKSAALMVSQTSQGVRNRRSPDGSSAARQSELAAEIRRHLAEACLRAGIPEGADFLAQADAQKD